MSHHSDLGLYVHVPFCLTKCAYCGFFSQPPTSGTPEKYLEHLFQELSQRLDASAAQQVRTVFIGGGNPTALGADFLRQIVEQLRQILSQANITEWTIETNPETLTQETLTLLRPIPALRLSIGLQRLRDEELTLLGRATRAARGFQALEEALEVTNNIGIDLILGVPGLPSVATDLDYLVRQFPVSHLSTYFLTVEDQTPLAGEVLAGRFPDPAEVGPEELMEVTDVLERHGYLPYEISNFARPGRECRHNLHYWHQGDYLGVGPAAVSTLGETRTANPASLEAWRSGEFQTEHLSREEQQREFLMLRLRLLSEGFTPSEYVTRYGSISSELVQKLEEQTTRGMLTRTASGYRLSREGLIIASRVMAELF